MADITVVSVNVNGLRGALNKDGSGMAEWFKSQRKTGLDVLCLQETKISKDNKDLPGICEKLGIDLCDFYLQPNENGSQNGGVATWINPDTCKKVSVSYPFENTPEAEELKFSGRWQEIVVSFAGREIAIANAYCHNAKSPTHRDNNGQRIDFEDSKKSMKAKHRFFSEITRRMRELTSKHKDFVLVGDINTAHKCVDLKNFKDNKKKAGFLPEERAWLDLWFADQDDITAMEVYKENPSISYTPPPSDQFAKGGLGLRDVIRMKLGDVEVYSFWSRRRTPRGYPLENNVGWRLDYQIASQSMAKSVKKADIQKHESHDKAWSDHAPVVVTYSL